MNRNRRPLTLMFLAGHETYPNVIADCMSLGIIPWRFGVRNMLDSTLKV